MFCIKCGTKNPETARFCIKCGQPLLKVEVPRKVRPARAPRRLFWLMGISMLTLMLLGVCVVAGVIIYQRLKPAPFEELVSLVPADANLIASIQVAKIINDPDFRAIYDWFPKEPDMPQTFREGLNQIKDELGIDLRDFSTVILFGDVSIMEEYFGVIAEGTFRKARLIEAVEELSSYELTSTDYRGYGLYTFEEEGAIAFLADNRFVFGSLDAVRDVINTKEGRTPRVKGKVYDAYINLEDALIRISMEFPFEIRREIMEEAAYEIPISINMDPIRDLDVAGFSFGKEEEFLTITIKMGFISTDSAEEAADTINSVIILSKGMIPIEEARALLGRVEAKASNSWVTIAFELSMEEIRDLIDAIEAMQ